jgi:hypothetical protein
MTDLQAAYANARERGYSHTAALTLIARNSDLTDGDVARALERAGLADNRASKRRLEARIGHARQPEQVR